MRGGGQWESLVTSGGVGGRRRRAMRSLSSCSRAACWRGVSRGQRRWGGIGRRFPARGGGEAGDGGVVTWLGASASGPALLAPLCQLEQRRHADSRHRPRAVIGGCFSGLLTG